MIRGCVESRHGTLCCAQVDGSTPLPWMESESPFAAHTYSMNDEITMTAGCMRTRTALEHHTTNNRTICDQILKKKKKRKKRTGRRSHAKHRGVANHDSRTGRSGKRWCMSRARAG